MNRIAISRLMVVSHKAKKGGMHMRLLAYMTTTMSYLQG